MTLLLLEIEVSAQNQTPPPGEQPYPTFQSELEAAMQPYAAMLDTMSERELAVADKDFKHLMRWKYQWLPRIHPQGSYMDYLLMKQNYWVNPKSGADDIGDWHELGPYSLPEGGVE